MQCRRTSLPPAAVVIVLGLSAGCGQSDETLPFDPPASLETDVAELRELKTVPSTPVQGFVGPGGKPFFVKMRTPAIGQHPCSACHQDPLGPPLSNSLIDARTMHRDIVMNHADEVLMDCRTCHDSDDLSQLHTISGTTVDFDHAYTLCAQCHFQQAADWAGGAHGKRLAGWRGKRVILNCTECHDPHRPQIATKMPVAQPSIPRTGGSR